MRKTSLGIAASLGIVALSGCSDHPATTLTAPTALSAAPVPSARVESEWAPLRPASVTFPGQQDPADFFSQLEVKYRTRPNTTLRETPINGLGYGVWISDYLRYRLSNCSHADATNKTLTEIRARGSVIPPDCGSVAPFPPQNEPVDFLQQMEI